MLAYEGLRPGEAYALVWGDVLDERGRPRKRLARQARPLGRARSRRRSRSAAASPSSFGPSHANSSSSTSRAGSPTRTTLVFPDSEGGHLRRQNWRRRVWIPALERAGVAYFRSYDLRHTCATLLLYEGRTLNEVAEHLGHADPGLHRAHLRARDARHDTQAPRSDHDGDPHGTSRRLP